MTAQSQCMMLITIRRSDDLLLLFPFGAASGVSCRQVVFLFMSDCQIVYRWEGKKGAHMFTILVWKQEREEGVFEWKVQEKCWREYKSLGTFKSYLNARDVASKRMADIQKQYGSQRPGVKLVRPDELNKN